MRKNLILLGICLFLLFGSLATGCSSSKIIEVNSNLIAENVKVGMVYNQDFVVEENYHLTFVKTINCSDIHIEGDTLHYTISTGSDYVPYFLWVCYPQITKLSQATIIAIEETGGSKEQSGTWTVIGVLRMDTTKCLTKFGGTYGTSQNNW